MSRERLNILFLAPFAPSPATFGAQRRVEGLMAALGRRHEISVVSVVPDDHDAHASERAMREYSKEVVLVSRPGSSWEGAGKRLLQVRSLLSSRSLVRGLYNLRSVREVLDRLLSARPYDIVNVELPFLASSRLAKSPSGTRAPRLVLDEHNVEFDLARQQTGNERGFARRLYNAINWRKIRREEMKIWSEFDGVAFCSAADQARALSLVPSLRSAVVPNAVDIEYFKPLPTHPPSDGCTVMFFGAINYFPNQDGLLYFLREVWPSIAKSNPKARLTDAPTWSSSTCRTVSAGQAYVFVVPEYNHSYNAATKNALDFLNEEWRHKPVGFVGYGGIAAGARAILALTPVVVALGMTPLSRAVHIPLINRALAADGSLTTDGRLDGSASTLLDDLFHHAERASIEAAAAV